MSAMHASAVSAGAIDASHAAPAFASVQEAEQVEPPRHCRRSRAEAAASVEYHDANRTDRYALPQRRFRDVELPHGCSRLQMTRRYSARKT
jgi:hypothetical protein